MKWLKKSRRNILAGVLVATLLWTLGLQVTDKSNVSPEQVHFGVGNEKVITLGPQALYAAGSVDYTFDGVDDNVQFQAALDSLPTTGGRLVVVSAVQLNFSGSVTRAIPNVTIEGTGAGTYFVYNNTNPIFVAGGDNWIFRDFSTDAGGINLGATTGYQLVNVLEGVTYYAFRSPTGQSIFNDTTVASLTNSGLTSGRIPIAGVGGLFGDDSDLTFSIDTTKMTTANITNLVGPLSVISVDSAMDFNGNGIRQVSTLSGPISATNLDFFSHRDLGNYTGGIRFYTQNAAHNAWVHRLNLEDHVDNATITMYGDVQITADSETGFTLTNPTTGGYVNIASKALGHSSIYLANLNNARACLESDLDNTFNIWIKNDTPLDWEYTLRTVGVGGSANTFVTSLYGLGLLQGRAQLFVTSVADNSNVSVYGGSTIDSANIQLQGKSAPGDPGSIYVRTPNAALATTSRLTISGATDVVTATWAGITQTGIIFTPGSPPKFSDNTTGAKTSSLGTNNPATDNSTPYTWIGILSGDGSTVYIPAWK